METATEETKLLLMSKRLRVVQDEVDCFTASLLTKTDSIFGSEVHKGEEDTDRACGSVSQASFYELETTVECVETSVGRLRNEVRRYTESGL